MTEDELIAAIAEVNTAISNMMKTGQEYEIESAKSRRRFKGFELEDLRKYRTELNNQLREVQGGSGLVLGF